MHGLVIYCQEGRLTSGSPWRAKGGEFVVVFSRSFFLWPSRSLFFFRNAGRQRIMRCIVIHVFVCCIASVRFYSKVIWPTDTIPSLSFCFIPNRVVSYHYKYSPIFCRIKSTQAFYFLSLLFMMQSDLSLSVKDAHGRHISLLNQQNIETPLSIRQHGSPTRPLSRRKYHCTEPGCNKSFTTR